MPSKTSKNMPVVRKIRFPIEPERLKNWMGSQAISDLFHGLSVLFPEGEKEFIDSVRPFAAKIEDPELKKQVDAFIKQEAHHTREHVQYNEALESLGYPAKRLEKELRMKIKWAQKNLSNLRRLAFTVCSEHFTAVMADVLLSEDFPAENVDPLLLAMWRWHAVEEIEHKAVAYDVYMQTGAGYADRVLTMLVVTALFGYDIAVNVKAMFEQDGIDPAEGWREVRKVLFKDTKLGWRALKNYVRFYKPGFHPWDHQNQYRIERWAAKYDGLMQELALAS